MSDRDFKKFLEEVQVSAVSDAPMPRMSDKKQATTATPAAQQKIAQNSIKSTAIAGSKRPTSKVVD